MTRNIKDTTMKADNLKQFEAYYNGDMEPDEKARFEALLKEDASLKADFDEYMEIYKAIGAKEIMDLRLKLKEIRDESFRGRPGLDFFNHRYNWVWVAALLTIILGLTVVITLLTTRPELNSKTAAGLEKIEVEEFSKLNHELMKYAQRNIDFNIDEPGERIFQGRKEPILFKWAVDSDEPLVLELIDWEGKIVYSSGKPVSSPFVVKSRFASGIFVYRFRTSTESFYLGLLFLR